MAPKRSSDYQVPASASSASSEEEQQTSSKNEDDQDEVESDSKPSHDSSEPSSESEAADAKKADKSKLAVVLKRVREDQITEAECSQKRKKKNKNDESAAPSSSTPLERNPHLFKRKWSEEDEINLLKGLIQYNTKRDEDHITTDMSTFPNFVKGSFSFDASVEQVKDKLKRLKKKFENNVSRKYIPWKKGHESNLYNLSIKAWGKKIKNISGTSDDHSIPNVEENTQLDNKSSTKKKIMDLGLLVDNIMLGCERAKEIVQKLKSSM